MKKFCFLIIGFSLISCGEEILDENRNGQIGLYKEVREDDVFSDKEKELIQGLCTSLDYKANILDAQIAGNASKKFKANIKRVDCDNKVIAGSAKTITMTVERDGDEFQFEGQNGERPNFEDIITNESNEIKDLCSLDLSQANVPRYKESLSSAKWFYFTDKTSSRCSEDKDDICTEVITAIKESTGRAKVKIIERFKVVGDDNNSARGFVQFRENLSSLGCTEDSLYEVRMQELL